MHTARSLPYGGISLTETPPDRDPPGQRPPGHVTCGACWDRTPPSNPVNRIIDACENIVAGGNNEQIPISKNN